MRRGKQTWVPKAGKLKSDGFGSAVLASTAKPEPGSQLQGQARISRSGHGDIQTVKANGLNAQSSHNTNENDETSSVAREAHERRKQLDFRESTSRRHGKHGACQPHSSMRSEAQTKEWMSTCSRLKPSAGSDRGSARNWDLLGELRQAAGISVSAAVAPQESCRTPDQDVKHDVHMLTDDINVSSCLSEDCNVDCLNQESCETEQKDGTEDARKGNSIQTCLEHGHPIFEDDFADRGLEPDALSSPGLVFPDAQDERDASHHEELVVVLLVDPPISWLDSDEDVLSLWHAQVTASDNVEQKGQSTASETADMDVCDSWEDLVDCSSSLADTVFAAKGAAPWYNRSFLLTARLKCSLSRRLDGSTDWCWAMQSRPRHFIDCEKHRASPKIYFVPVRGITDESLTVGHENFQWNALNVMEKPYWNSHSQVVNVKWRVHCIDLCKRPRIFQSGHRNTWNLHGPIGDWTKTDLTPGILEINLAIERGQEMQVHAVEREEGHEITRVVLTDKFALCMEHRKLEVGIRCFCPEAFAEAGLSGLVVASDVQEWGSVAEYIADWRAAVELEAAYNAIDDGDSRHLFNVDIVWKYDCVGCFEIPGDLAIAHKMKLRSIMVSENGFAEWGAGWLCLRRNFGTGSHWCGHGAIVSASVIQDDDREEILKPDVGEEEDLLTRVAGDGHRVRITFRLSVASSCVSQGYGLSRGYVVEILPKTLPYSCMASALVELAWCSQSLQDAVLRGRVDASDRLHLRDINRSPFSRHEDWLSDLREEPTDLSGWSLNLSQCVAVRNALREPLSLIHGPPGTGKTKTASILAALFSLQNVCDGAPAVVLYCAPSNDAADVACLRVGEVAAEHFKAVADIHPLKDRGDEMCAICLGDKCDAITTCKHVFHKNCLEKALSMSSKRCPVCRRVLHQPGGGVHMLRVYSAEIERIDFPVPKKIDHPTARPRKARFVRQCMRTHALHWRCHGLAPDVIPTSEAIETGMAYARLLQTSPQNPCFNEARAEYFAALALARAAELRQADIIFATCITSRRGALAAALRDEGAPEIRQVIVDEAGQAPEPETLCPLTLAKVCRQVVLVGDPKQLQPIIKNTKAQHLGLNVSMLERLSNLPWGRPMTLNVQYRMHPELNAFPSAFFYNGSLRTDESIRARANGLLEHPGSKNKRAALLFWKSGNMQAEQLSQVKTSDSNARSRFNPEEASRAADLARSLATHVGSSEVAVLSWYNAQVAKISLLLQGTGVHVGSVVTSQGGEWDYVILSTVRAGSGSIGCLADEHLLNVALTRARLGACVLGTSATLRQGSSAWSAFLDHCEQHRLVITERPTLRR